MRVCDLVYIMPRYGFCFTVNNYLSSQVNTLKGALGQCGISYIVFGYETAPSTGTKHLQGYLQSNNKMKDRFYKKFGIYVMAQERSTLEASDYCKKDGDFFEAGDIDMDVKGSKEKNQGKRSDLDEVKVLVKEGKTYQEIVETHFGCAAKHHKFIKEQVAVQRHLDGRSILLSEYEGVSWKPWQQGVLDVLAETPNRRKIHWIWEPLGNVGKSWLAKYVLLTQDALLLESGKKVDMAYIYAQKPTKIVMIDLSRTSAPTDGKDYLGGVYSICENLKNGTLMSTKYESAAVQFQIPHVIVFANWEPDYTKWSRDRYLVTKL